MGKTKTKLYGTPVAKHQGYNIRMMVTNKTDDKTKKTVQLHNGKYGVFAGKQNLKEVSSVEEGINEIDRLLKSKIKH